MTPTEALLIATIAITFAGVARFTGMVLKGQKRWSELRTLVIVLAIMWLPVVLIFTLGKL